MAHGRGTRAATLLAAVGLLFGLAACGDDNGSTKTASQASTTAASTPTTAAAATTTTAAAAVLKTANSDKFGTILVDSSGKSLYTFDRDTSSTSSCTGTCAQTWPALLAPAGVATPTATGVTGTLAVSARPDGSGNQVTLNGKPLYRYSGDPNAGDTNGDGVGGVWHIAKP